MTVAIHRHEITNRLCGWGRKYFFLGGFRIKPKIAGLLNLANIQFRSLRLLYLLKQEHNEESKGELFIVRKPAF